MRVEQMIALLALEDPKAEVVIVLSRYKETPLINLMALERGYFNSLVVAGKETVGANSAVVIIAGRDE